MPIKEMVLKIMKELMPTKELQQVNDIVEGGYIDSFDLMNLITALSEEFGIDVDLDDMTPENFNSVDAITEFVLNKKG